jgi:UDP-N-acetyl-D-mannosaminuronate dehydrogenase
LAEDLLRRGARVVAHDPLAAQLPRDEVAALGLTLMSVEECLDAASVVVIANPEPAYAQLDADDFIRPERPAITVVDCWRLLSGKLSNRTGIRYVAIGRSLDDAGNEAKLGSLSTETLER